MNFYTFFKSETKKACKFYNLEYPEFPASLNFFRNSILRAAFGNPCLDVHHFQIACYRVVPVDFPKSFYENLYDKTFGLNFRNLVLFDEFNKLTDYVLRLSSEIDSILESENV